MQLDALCFFVLYFSHSRNAKAVNKQFPSTYTHTHSSDQILPFRSIKDNKQFLHS